MAEKAKKTFVKYTFAPIAVIDLQFTDSFLENPNDVLVPLQMESSATWLTYNVLQVRSDNRSTSPSRNC